MSNFDPLLKSAQKKLCVKVLTSDEAELYKGGAHSCFSWTSHSGGMIAGKGVQILLSIEG